MFRRLPYLPRVLVHGPPLLTRFLGYMAVKKKSWSKQIMDDLEEVRPHAGHNSILRANGSFTEICAAIRNEPAAWTAATKAARAAHKNFHVEMARTETWKNEFAATAEEGGCAPIRTPGQALPAQDGFLCYECGEVLQSRSLWKKHYTVKHGHIDESRRYAYGTACSSCLRDFHTQARLRWHLANVSGTRKCLMAAKTFFPPMSDAEVAAAEEEDREELVKQHRRGHSRYHAKLPPKKLF